MNIRDSILESDIGWAYRAEDRRLRREFEAGAMDDRDLEGFIEEGRLPKPRVEAAISAGYPFGEGYPFGIYIDGMAVSVYPQIIYRGGKALKASSPPGGVTLTTDGDWVALRYNPANGTCAYVRWEHEGYPEDRDGLIYRGLHQFDVDTESETVTWRRAGWLPCDLGMMGY